MIAGIFHKGSGVGNQLHRYVATRVLALDKGTDFAMLAPSLCKVNDFMKLDLGNAKDVVRIKKLDEKTGLNFSVEEKTGKVTSHFDLPLWEEKTNYYNPEFNFIEDNTIIDGEFQDERYFEHRMSEVNDWLKVNENDVSDDGLCVIGFRGGEFSVFPELFLPQKYWYDAMWKMRHIKPEMRFVVHTDDVETAKKFFPDLHCIHDVGYNWRSMRCAKYAIVANSSFYILPRLLRHHTQKEAVTIAPRYWARHNTKEWSMPQNYYKCFTYL